MGSWRPVVAAAVAVSLVAGALLFLWTREPEGEEQTMKITLIGDSLIEWGDWADLLDGEIHNHGVAGETSGEIADRASEALTGDEDAVVLWAGTNDVGTGLPVEHTRADLARLLGSVRAAAPDARVIILEVPPLAWAPEQVEAVNGVIGEEASDPAVGATVVPVADALAPDGARSPDGVHIEPPGYTAVAELVGAHLP